LDRPQGGHNRIEECRQNKLGALAQSLDEKFEHNEELLFQNAAPPSKAKKHRLEECYRSAHHTNDPRANGYCPTNQG
jgi:hypothetical protein